MKKFAMIAHIGNYNNEAIDCTVVEMEFVKDSDDFFALFREAMAKGTEYRANGKWYSYHVDKRADARRELKRYGKM